MCNVVIWLLLLINTWEWFGPSHLTPGKEVNISQNRGNLPASTVLEKMCWYGVVDVTRTRVISTGRPCAQRPQSSSHLLCHHYGHQPLLHHVYRSTKWVSPQHPTPCSPLMTLAYCTALTQQLLKSLEQDEILLYVSLETQRRDDDKTKVGDHCMNI